MFEMFKKKFKEEEQKSQVSVVEVNEYSKDMLKLLNTSLVDLVTKYCSSEDNNYIINLVSEEKYDLTEEKSRISKMSRSGIQRPIMIYRVQNSLGTINTHWAMAYVVKFGTEAKLKDVPFYLVDADSRTILDYKKSFNNSQIHMDTVTQKSKQLQGLMCSIDKVYSIGDLLSLMSRKQTTNTKPSEGSPKPVIASSNSFCKIKEVY